MLQSIPTVWKAKSRAPEHWSTELGGTQERMYHTILSTRLEKLEITYDAVKGQLKELNLLHL